MDHERSEFAGMTVNERLYLSGHMDEWDRAVRRGDRRRLAEILSAVEIVETEPIIDFVLASPLRRATAGLCALFGK